jgi:AraC-like DNA-binding protein
MVAAAGMAGNPLQVRGQAAIALGDEVDEFVDLRRHIGRGFDLDPAADALEDLWRVERIGHRHVVSDTASFPGAQTGASAGASADAAADLELIDPEAAVDQLLDWLEAHKYLSETRFVESRVNASSRKQGTLLIKLEQKPYTTGGQKHKIDPAIRYLEEHLFDADLKVSALPVLCGVSAPSFRRIFVSRFGTTPKKYLQQQRLQAAKLMLEGGEYADIGAVAQAVGFEDPLHFSKCFKAFCGAPPSKIK